MNDQGGTSETPSGMSQWPSLGTPDELARIMGGTWTSNPASPIVAIRHRLDLMEEGAQNFLFAPELFADLNGPDGRAALLASAGAVERMAAGLIVSRRPRNLDPAFPCLIVANPTAAIARLATRRRAQSGAKFFAVAGSVGKSTTKYMIHRMSSVAGPAHCDIANYNAGLASIRFTLAGLAPAHRFCSVEFSEVGGLEEQIGFYRPHISVITNVHEVHVGRMERDGYGAERVLPRLAELCAGVVRHLQPGGTCVLNADEENFNLLAGEVRKTPHAQLRKVGAGPDNDVRILEIECGAWGSDVAIEVGGKPHRYHLSLPGRHMAVNSVMAAAAVHFAGIDLEQALAVLKHFQTGMRRGTKYRIPWGDGHITLRDESVSSSPPSLRSSLAQIETEMPEGQGRRIAVLGQMNETGERPLDTMVKLAREAEAGSVARFYTVGSPLRMLNESITDRSRVAPHFQSLEMLEKTLRAELIPGDVVFCKGSRRPEQYSMRTLVDRLTAPAFAPPGPVTGPSVRLVIGGDTYFGESYQEKRIKSMEINFLDTYGYGYSAEKIAPLFKRADFAVANLECALTSLRESGLEGKKDYILAGSPAETIAALKGMNIDAALLGNNHAMDYLGHGLEETLVHLADAGMQVSGGGSSRMAAQRPILKTFDVGGIDFKTAIISGYAFNANYEAMGFYAGDASFGVNNINMRRLREQIAELRADGYFVIVSPHWGANYSFRTTDQAKMADGIVECGADLILGHGPHMMNEIAQNRGVWVVYSLGNLIFNSEGEYVRRQLQPYSLIAELEFSRRGPAVCGRLNLYPIVSCNQMTQFQPVFVDDGQFQQVKAVLAGTQYDQDGFCRSVSFGEIDGRHSISMKLF